MGLLEDCRDLFGSSDLYEVLGVPLSSSEAEVRRGYYKTSLQVHPDRAPQDPQATSKFQTLGKVYAVLSVAEQRAVYDEHGIVDEESDTVKEGRDWDEYWRLLFPKVTLQDIVNFEQTYNGSDEEQQDLLRLYRDCSGDMDQILDSALCCGPDDEPRVRHILQAAIDGGDLPALRAFTHENRRKKAARKRKADTERAQSEQLKKELSLDEVNDLSSVVKRRAASREASFSSLISSMEEKYCNNKPGSGSQDSDSRCRTAHSVMSRLAMACFGGSQRTGGSPLLGGVFTCRAELISSRLNQRASSSSVWSTSSCVSAGLTEAWQPSMKEL